MIIGYDTEGYITDCGIHIPYKDINNKRFFNTIYGRMVKKKSYPKSEILNLVIDFKEAVKDLKQKRLELR